MGKAAKIHDIAKKETTREPAVRQGFLSPFEEMERMMQNMFTRNWMLPSLFEYPTFHRLGWKFEDRLPAVDIIDREDELLVRVELPGVQKDQLEVTLADNALTIKASAKQEKKLEKDDYYRSEISSGCFSRTVSLPCAIDTEKVKASFKDGLLELTLPKVERVKKHSVRID